jgi:hypothetical protein
MKYKIWQTDTLTFDEKGNKYKIHFIDKIDRSDDMVMFPDGTLAYGLPYGEVSMISQYEYENFKVEVVNEVQGA